MGTVKNSCFLTDEFLILECRSIDDDAIEQAVDC